MLMPASPTHGLLLAAGLCCAFTATAFAQTEREVYLATVGRDPTEPVALFARPAAGDPVICRDAEFGTATVDEDYVFRYRADPEFSGEDRVCATVCGPDGETDCETVTVTVTVLSPGAAVRVDMANVGDRPFLACVDLPFAGPYAEPTIREVDQLFALAGDPGDPSCLVLDPADGEVGTGRVDAIFCSATNRSFCRQVEFVIDQGATCDPPRLEADTVVLASAPTPFRYCVAGGAPLGDYEVVLNGIAYEPIRSSDCGASEAPTAPATAQFFYDLRFAPAQAASTFELDTWRVDGVDRAGTFASLAQLADSMTAWDPGNDWRYDADVPELAASGTAGDPSVLVLTLDPAAGGSAFVRDDRAGAAGPGAGAVVEFGAVGWHDIELVDRDGACGERQAIYLTPPRRPTTDTVEFVVRAGADTRGLCVPLDDLYGEAPTSVEIVSPAAVGTLRAEGFRCFAYGVGEYAGRDVARVVHCSARLGICDTTVLAFAVGAGCDSISLSSSASAQTTECQSGVSFDFRAAPRERLGDLEAFVDGDARPIFADSAGFSVVVPVGRRVVTVRDAGRECFADFSVEVECIACDEPLPGDLTREVTCGSPAQAICLPVDAVAIAEYDVALDGEAVAGPFADCEGGVVLQVDGTLPGQTLTLTRRDNDCTVETALTYTCREAAVTSDTLTVGEVGTYCLDEPRGLVGEPVTGQVACASAGERLDVTASETPQCFDLVALAAGTERFCYVVCDGVGACDTAFYEFTVGYPLWDGLAAVDDSLAVVAGRERTWVLTANDSLSSEEYAVTLASGPALGTATVDLAGRLTYAAPAAACGATDSLSYRLCIDTTCRTAVARIAVRCDPVVVYEGFSPNGDGINDRLVIVGLEELEAFDLQVFSRWGTRVFETESYDEGWDGTWENGGLPDGLYFYVITYREGDGSPGVTTGCTLLRR